ncbi:hypothetical protein PG985_009465 [Apiospora marii]|uniref:uncharacterized protein n=1 Tax=Apiospora marii TaxID=335849 RepID=UPI00312F1A81
MSSSTINRAVGIGDVMEDGRINHGGLSASIHNKPNTPIAKYGGLSASIHNKPDRSAQSSRNNIKTTINNDHGNGHKGQNSAARAPSASANAGAQVQLAHVTGNTQSGTNGSTGTSQAQSFYVAGVPAMAQAPRRYRIETSGGFYTLPPNDRDELWRAMKIKSPAAYANCESWAIPFPAFLDINELCYRGYNDTCLSLDERWVRLVFRTHYDADNNKVAKDLLLTPPNPSINIRDVRFCNALADAWWKIGRWMNRLMKGDIVKLWVHFAQESKLELRQKLGRV